MDQLSVDLVLEAIRGGRWNVVAASAITAAVWAARRWLPHAKRLPKKHLPIVATAIATLACVGASLGDQHFHPQNWKDWADCVLRGATQGLAASGAWSIGLKKWMKLPDDQPPQGNA